MTDGITAATANAILDAVFRGVDYPGNTAVWVKLHTGNPGAAGTSNAATETTRKQASFAAASGAAIATNADLVWSSYPAAETITNISFWTAATAGTFLGAVQLAAGKAMQVGDTLRIASGQLSATLGTIAG